MKVFRFTLRAHISNGLDICIVLLGCAMLSLLASGSLFASVANARVTTFPQPYALAGSSTTTLQGTPTADGGCAFPPGRLTLPRAERAVELREVGLDAQTCTATIEQGVPPASALGQDVPADGFGFATSSGNRAPTASAARHVNRRPTAHAAAYAYAAGYEKDWFEDPVGIDVNKVISKVGFHYGGGCVRDASWSGEWFWFTTSGWNLISNSNYGNVNCGQAYSSSWGHFKNGAFCAGANVESYYNRTVVYGSPSGGLSATWNSYNTGAVCKSLLSFHRTLVRTS